MFPHHARQVRLLASGRSGQVRACPFVPVLSVLSLIFVRWCRPTPKGYFLPRARRTVRSLTTTRVSCENSFASIFAVVPGGMPLGYRLVIQPTKAARFVWGAVGLPAGVCSVAPASGDCCAASVKSGAERLDGKSVKCTAAGRVGVNDCRGS